jgi:hypothetical protein
LTDWMTEIVATTAPQIDLNCMSNYSSSFDRKYIKDLNVLTSCTNICTNIYLL